MFQSAPANYSGRIPGKLFLYGDPVAVSIRARQLQRANPTKPTDPGTLSMVSIRARQLQRANPFGQVAGAG